MQHDFFEDFRLLLEGKKLVIVGVGNRRHGDDGLGPAMIDRLRGKLDVPLIDAGDVPENSLGPIEAARADLALVIDAADLRAAPGDLALLELDQLGEMAVSTHTVNLGALFKVIPPKRRPRVFVLAVQPETTAPGSGLSLAVRSALDGIESLLLGVVA